MLGKHCNKILIVILIFSGLIICMPIITIWFPGVKAWVLSVFHSKDNSYQYLQFIGVFLGVTVTITSTILLQEKQKYENIIKEKKTIKRYLHNQLKCAFNLYLEAQRNNTGNKMLFAFGPRKIDFDANWSKELLKIADVLDDSLYDDILNCFDSLTNTYSGYLVYSEQVEKWRLENGVIIQGSIPKEIKQLDNLIVGNVDAICVLYNKKYKDVLGKFDKVVIV